MTNTGTQTRRPSTTEILAADELLTAIRSLEALGSRVTHDLRLQLERFLMDVAGETGELLLEWLEEFSDGTVADAVAVEYDGVTDDNRIVQTSCHNCELDIEGSREDGFRDRGGNSRCPSGERHVPSRG